MAKLSGPTGVFNTDTLSVDSTQRTALGTRAWDPAGNEYIYLQGTASVVASDWVVYDEGFTTTRLTANEVGPVAVAATAVVTGEYGWFQIYGITQGNSDTISADKSLYIDGTAGRVDDLGVSGDLVINAYSMSASVSNVATCYISYPTVSDDLGGAAGGVPTGAQYVVIAADTDLTDERILTGTSNQITVTDGGAGGNVTLSTPQNINSTAQVNFGSVAINGFGLVLNATTTISTFGGTLTDDASASAARTTLGVAIGTDVQAFDAQLSDIAALTPTASTMIAGDGSNFVSLTAAQTRSSLLLGASDSPQFTAVNIGDAADTTLSRASAGDLNIEANIIYRAGGTDVPVADGGTGASSFTATAVILGGATSTGALTTVSGLGTSGQVLTSNGAALAPTWQAAAAGGGGASTAEVVRWIDAADFSLPDSAFAARAKYGTTFVFTVLDFDPSTDESAFYKIQIPRYSKASATTVVEFLWTAGTGFASATSSAVIWQVVTRAITSAEAFDSTASPAYATATVTSQLLANNQLSIGTAMVVQTGTAWAAADLLEIQVRRDADAGGDNLTSDARLFGVNVSIQG